MKNVIERILNLLAFLLTVNRPVTAEEIRSTVAGYDQANDEWVMVLRGRGAVEFAAQGEEEGRVVELGPGDYLHIPARRRHRVAWTSEDEPTVWLAVHYLTLRPKVRPELSDPPPRG